MFTLKNILFIIAVFAVLGILFQITILIIGKVKKCNNAIRWLLSFPISLLSAFVFTLPFTFLTMYSNGFFDLPILNTIKLAAAPIVLIGTLYALLPKYNVGISLAVAVLWGIQSIIGICVNIGKLEMHIIQLICMILLSSGIIMANKRHQKKDDILAKAKDLQSNGNDIEAISCCMNKLKTNKKNIELKQIIIICLEKLKDDITLLNWKLDISEDCLRKTAQYSSKYCNDCRLTRTLGEYGLNALSFESLNGVNPNASAVSEKILKKAMSYSQNSELGKPWCTESQEVFDKNIH